MSKKRTVLTALLPAVTFLLASCGSVPTPHDPSATMHAQNTDICPSCGRAALTAWVAPAAAADLQISTGDGTGTEVFGRFPVDLPLLDTAALIPAVVTHRDGLSQLTVVSSPDRARPVACLQAQRSPRPAGVPAPTIRGNEVSDTWSGGLLMLSGSVTRAAVLTLDAADQVCQNEFGLSWRALRMQDTTDALPLGVRPVSIWATPLP